MIEFLDLLESNFAKHESDTAFVIKGKAFTYFELRNRIGYIQQQILSLNIAENEANFGLITKDDFSTYAAILAIWYLGFAYVPLGMQNPDERNLAILEESNITFILTANSLSRSIYINYEIIDIGEAKVDCEKSLIRKGFCVDKTAYVLFTSGSTGKPKGVPISFKSLDSFLTAFEKTPFVIQSFDRCLQMYELTFDISIAAFLAPLLKGASVYTVGNEGVRYMEVLKLIRDHKLTSIQIVPSIVRLAFPLMDRLIFPDVKQCILSGEATTMDLLSKLKKSIPNSIVYNFYGPTEATIYCSYYKSVLDVEKNYNGMMVIGKPFSGIEFRIVDEALAEVKPMNKGELLISGKQLSFGYLNNPEKNEQSFLKLNFAGEEKVYYRTGDMCYVDEFGDVFYCGRYDNQVKIQGYRIELSEIEVCVRSNFGINNVVIPNETKGSTMELILAIEGVNRHSIEEIHDYLKSRLPAYMVPARIFEMDVFPINSSGKTDRVTIKKVVSGEQF